MEITNTFLCNLGAKQAWADPPSADGEELVSVFKVEDKDLKLKWSKSLGTHLTIGNDHGFDVGLAQLHRVTTQEQFLQLCFMLNVIRAI